MKRAVRCSGMVIIAFFAAGSLFGATLEVLNPQVAGVGGTLRATVVVSGLGDLTSPSLGAFDVTLSFDPAVLGFASVDFGVFLGDEAAGEALTGFQATSDEVMVFEVSLLQPDVLDALQSSSFPLFTVTFNALELGTSSLLLSLNAPLSDEFGEPLPADVITSSVTVALAEIFDDGFETGDTSQWSSVVVVLLD